MKRTLKYLAIIFILFLLFIAYVVWLNLSFSSDNEAFLAELPKQVTPKYNTTDSNNWWKKTSVYQIYPRSLYLKCVLLRPFPLQQVETKTIDSH